MKHTITLFALLFFLLTAVCSSQAQEYRVQIAAFTKKVPFTHFFFSGIKDYYCTQDQNNINRCYMGPTYNSVKEAEADRQELIKRGFSNAQIIDIEREKSLCTEDDPAARQGLIYTNINTEHLYFRNLYFKFGRSSLTLEAMEKLDRVYAALQESPELNISVLGHADAIGSPEYNIKLSARRARMVRNYLVAKGIHANRISVEVFGESAPIAVNLSVEGKDMPKGRAYNRRVVVAVTDSFGEVVNDTERMKEVPGHLRINKQILHQQLMYARQRR